MVSAISRPPCSRAQRSARIVKARLSGPPETATAMNGLASKPPIAASTAFSSPSISGAAGMAGSAAETLLLGRGALLDRGAGSGEIMVELGQYDTGVLLLIGAAQRHAQLQQFVSRLRAFRPALVAFSKGARRLGVAAARVIGLAQPVLRVAAHRVIRVLLDKGFQGYLGGRVIGLLQQTECLVVLLAGRAARHRPDGRRRGDAREFG